MPRARRTFGNDGGLGDAAGPAYNSRIDNTRRNGLGDAAGPAFNSRIDNTRRNGLGLGAWWNDPVQSVVDKYNAAVADWRAKLAALDAAESNLYNVRDQAMKDPKTAQEWQTNFNKINAIKSTISSVEGSINTIASWIATAKGAVGLSGAAYAAVSGLGALGIAPLVVVGAIIGGTSAIAAVVFSVNQFIQKMNERAWMAENIRRSQAGEPLLDPSTDPAKNRDSGGFFDGAATIVKWSVAGLILWQAMNMFQQSRRKS
jgi:ABC-type multidrug transport system fused ATPase/permease subunit